MTDFASSIIFYSGWFIALVLFIWQVYERARFRQKIKVNIESIVATGENQSTKYLMVTAKNEGRRPFHAMDIGVLLSNGENFTFFTPYLWAPSSAGVVASDSPPFSWVTPSVWLYRTRPYQYGVSYTILKEQKSKQNTSIDKVYITEETGDVHIWEIPKLIRQELNN